MGSKRAKVFIVDDYPPMRDSLRTLLTYENDFEVCGEADDVEDALSKIQTTQPDVAIVDLILGRQTGLDLLRRLKTVRYVLPVLILSFLPETVHAEDALKEGARGYIMKSESPELILDALRRVAQGERYLSRELREQLIKKGASQNE